MDWDDVTAKLAQTVEIGAALSNLSIRELEARIVALENEIGRVQAELAAKRASQAAADSIFK